MWRLIRKYIKTRKPETQTDHGSAQGLLEFALVLPVLLLIVLGIIEFGRLLFMFGTVTASSREGARYAASTGDLTGSIFNYEDCAGILGSIVRIGSLVGVETTDVTIEYTKYLKDGTVQVLNGCPPGEYIDLGDRITVIVTRDFQPIVPLVNLPGFPISATTSRTLVRDVGIKGTPPTPLPTKTSTPTLTPTASNTPDLTTCDIYYSTISISENEISFNVINDAGGTIRVTSMDITWPDSSNKSLEEIRMGGQVIFNTKDNNSPTNISGEGDWITGSESDRSINDGGTKGVTIEFKDPAASTGYSIVIGFTNGCTITVDDAGPPTSTPTHTETSTGTSTSTSTQSITPSPTDTPTTTLTPSITLTPSETLTPSITPTPTDTLTPSITPSPTLTFTPSDTPTPSNTPTNTSTPTPTNTPIPPCDPAMYKIVSNFQADVYETANFYSVYLRMQNTSSNPLTITKLNFSWPYTYWSTRMSLKEIRFADFTEWSATCAFGTTCLWNGWNGTESYRRIEVCPDCVEYFDGTLSDRQLNPSIFKYLKFVFWQDLRPGEYNVRIEIDNICYIENYQTSYIHE